MWNNLTRYLLYTIGCLICMPLAHSQPESCSQAIPLTCGETVYLDNFNTGNTFNSHDCNTQGTFAGNDVVFSIYKSQADGDLSIDLFPDSANLDLFLYTECPFDSGITCIRSSTRGNINRENVFIEDAPIGTYYIVVDARFASRLSSFSLTANCGTLDCSDIVTLTCGVPYFGTNAGGAYNVSRYCGVDQAISGSGCDGPERLHQFTLATTSEVTIDLVVLDGESDLELILLDVCQADACIDLSTREPGQAEQITRVLLPGTYTVVVDGWKQGISDYELTVTCCATIQSADCGLDYEFIGSNSTLQYLFFPTNGGTFASGQPWIVNGQERGVNTPVANFIFSRSGSFEICYPYTPELNVNGNTSASSCTFEYCCETFCIEPQPANLAGLTSCVDCGCTEGDPFLPPAFVCDDFDEYAVDQPLPQNGENGWFGGLNPFIRQTEEGKQYLEFFADEVFITQFATLAFLLETGQQAPLGQGRYRISFELFVEGSAGFGAGSTHAGDTNPDLFNLAFEEGQAVDGSGTLSFSYPQQTWFELSQVFIVGQFNTRIEFFVNRQYVGKIIRPTSSLGQYTFLLNGGSNYRIDNICARTVPIEADCAPDIPVESASAVCLPFGAQYDSACQAGQTGLYAQGEYEKCFTVCDFGGELITRNDQTVPVRGELTAFDRAPNGFYADSCVQALYDGEVPEILYADIYTFENDEQVSIDIFVDLVEPFELSPEVNILVYTCDCSSGDCIPICVPLSDTIEPFGVYQFVIFSEVPVSYELSIFPTLNDCFVNDSFILNNSSNEGADGYPLPNSVIIESSTTAGNTFYSAASGDGLDICYSGFRQYAGEDRLYRLDVEYPSFVSFDLSISNGVAGMFLFANVCTQNCIGYADTELFSTSVRWDSVRLGQGTYYLIVDQEVPVDNFTLEVIYEPDRDNFNSGVAFFGGEGCVTDPAEFSHDYTLLIPPNTFRVEDSISILAEYVYYDPVSQEFKRGAPSSFTAGTYKPALTSTDLYFNLSQQTDPNALRCAFLPGDSIRFSARTGRYVQELIPSIFYDSLLAPDRDLFVPGGSTYSNFRINETYTLDLFVDQVFLRANGQSLDSSSAFFVVRSSAPIKVEAAPGFDWIQIPQSEFFGDDQYIVQIAADALEGTLPRRGAVRITTQTDAPIVQELSVFQFAACTEADLSVSVAQPDLCLGDSTRLILQVGDRTGQAVLDQYKVYLDSQLINDNLWLQPQIDTQYTVTVLDRACSEEDSAQISIRVFDRPAFSIGSTECSADLLTYSATFSTDVQPEQITLSQGELTELGNATYQVVNIPSNTILELSLSTGQCTTQERIFPPVCECPSNIPTPGATQTLFYYCEGESLPTLEVASSTEYMVNWYDADGTLLQTDDVPRFTPDSAGIYYAEYVDVNFTACRSDVRQEFEVLELATLELAPIPDPVFCSGEALSLNVELTADSTSLPVDFAWADGTSGANYIAVPTDTGRQSIDLIVSYAGAQCPLTVSYDFYVIPEPTFQQVNREPCGSDPDVYTYEFRIKADTFSVSAGQLSETDSSVIVSQIPIEDSLIISYYNEREGVICGENTVKLAPPPDCNCPSNELNYPYSEETYQYCPDSVLTPLEFPDPGIGFELVFYRVGETDSLSAGESTFTPPGPGEYYFQIRALERGCLGAINYPFSVGYYDYPVANAGEDQSVCVGEPVILDGLGSFLTGSGTWEWSGSINITNRDAPQAVFTPVVAGTTEILLSLTGSNQCTDTDLISITASDRPTFTVEQVDVFNCNSELTSYSVTFEASVIPGTPSHGTLISENGSYRIEDIPSGVAVNIPLTDDACTVVETILPPDCSCPTVPSKPQVAQSELFYCADEAPPQLTVTDLTGYRVNWYYAGGQLLAADTQTFTPEGPGTYAVEYENKDFFVCRSEQTTITVTNLADIVWDPFPQQVICEGDELLLAASVTHSTPGVPLEYRWNGDLGGSTFTTTPLDTGSQEISLAISYSDERCAQTEMVPVYVIPQPTITPLNLEPCGEDTTTYLAAFTTDADSYSIIAPSGTAREMGDSVFIENISLGDSVKVFAYNERFGISCPPVTYSFYNSPNSCNCASNNLEYSYPAMTYYFCKGEMPTALDFPDPGEEFDLVFFTSEGQEVLSQGRFSMVPPDAGDYYFQIRDTTQGCASFLTYPFSVVFREVPVADAGGDLSACAGVSVSLDGTNSTSQGNTEWLWAAEITLENVTTATPTALPDNPGDFSILLRVTNEFGCISRDTITLTVKESPVAAFELLDTLACPDDSNGRVAVSSSGGTGPYTFEWANGQTTQVRSGLAAGNYPVTVTDAEGCATVETYVLTAPPAISIVDTVIAAATGELSNGSISLTVTGGTPPYQFDWFIDEAPLPGQQSTLSDLMAGESYRVAITDANGCIFNSGFLGVPMSTDLVTLGPDNFAVRAYPNPTSGQFTLALNRTGVASVRITEVDGKVLRRVSNRTDAQGLLTLDLQDIPGGVYFVGVTLGTQFAIIPIMKW